MSSPTPPLPSAVSNTPDSDAKAESKESRKGIPRNEIHRPVTAPAASCSGRRRRVGRWHTHADLQQQISTGRVSGAAHPLFHVGPALADHPVDRELGERGGDSLAGAVAFAVVDGECDRGWAPRRQESNPRTPRSSYTRATDGFDPRRGQRAHTALARATQPAGLDARTARRARSPAVVRTLRQPQSEIVCSRHRLPRMRNHNPIIRSRFDRGAEEPIHHGRRTCPQPNLDQYEDCAAAKARADGESRNARSDL